MFMEEFTAKKVKSSRIVDLFDIKQQEKVTLKNYLQYFMIS